MCTARSAEVWGWVEPPFKKWGGGLDRISREVAEKEICDFFPGGRCSFSIKNKLWSGICNHKNVSKLKGISVLTKNLNWNILTKNLVTFKRWDGVKDEKL